MTRIPGLFIVTVVLLPVATLFSFRQLKGQETVPEREVRTKPARVLHFPEEKSLGMLSSTPKPVGEEKEDFGWFRVAFTDIGPAQGDVTVPSNHLIRLDVSVAHVDDLKPLQSIDPDTIDYVHVDSAVNCQSLRWVGKLTGLRAFYCREVPIDDDLIKSFSNLQNLDFFMVDGEGVTDDSLHVLAQMKRLKALRLMGSKITDAGVPVLAGCHCLQKLTLSKSDVTGSGLNALVMLQDLTSLDLGGANREDMCAVDDDGMKSVNQLGQLEHLDLGFTSITDEGLANLNELRNLRTITLDGTDVTDEGLRHLTDMKKLTRVRFYREGQSLGDVAAEHLSQLPMLERITTSWNLSDEGYMHLANLQRLKNISLENHISDETLERISQMKGLESLKLGDVDVSDAGFSKLLRLKNLSNLSIRYRFADMDHLRFGLLSHNGNLKSLSVSTEHGRRPGKSWEELSKILSLESLRISSFLITGKDWQPVGQLSNLRQLRIDTQVVLDDECFLALGNLSQLETLDLSDAELSHKNLKQLLQLKQLKFLRCSGEMDDEGLMLLARLPSLESLYVRSNRITESGINRFQRRAESVKLRVSGYSSRDSFSINEDGFIQMWSGEKRAALDKLIGVEPPKLVLDDLKNVGDADSIVLGDLKGSIVVVDFCRAFVAHSSEEQGLVVKKAFDKFKDSGVKFVGVHSTRNAGMMPAFIAAHGIAWPMGADRADETAELWNLHRTSAIFIIGRNGKIRMADLHPEELERAIQKLLDEK